MHLVGGDVGERDRGVGVRGCGLSGAAGGVGVGQVGAGEDEEVVGKRMGVSGVLRLLGRRRREEWYVRTARLLG